MICSFPGNELTAIVTGIECMSCKPSTIAKLKNARLKQLDITGCCLIRAMEGEYSDAMSTTSRSGKTYYMRSKASLLQMTLQHAKRCLRSLTATVA
jgi:hypothetical protein